MQWFLSFSVQARERTRRLTVQLENKLPTEKYSAHAKCGDNMTVLGLSTAGGASLLMSEMWLGRDQV